MKNMTDNINNWTWYDLEETGSTNDDAVSFSAHANGKKFVFSSKIQTKGRGRRGRTWLGLDGNLFSSFGCEVPIHRFGQLVFVVSLSVASTVLKLSPSANILLKWPNDVLLNGKKISGILLEKGEGDYIITGLGVNIKKSPMVPDCNYQTTSLQEAGINTDRISFLKLFLEEFDNQFNIWSTRGFEPIKTQWLRLAKGIGEEITIIKENETISGIFKCVDDNGLLLLQKEDKLEKIYAGDVFYK